MRILALGARVDLGSLYLALAREGHQVRVHANDPGFPTLFDGLVEKVADWCDSLPWLGPDGFILFEKVGRGALQDELRRDGYRVIGGSALGDRLEYDRGFGQDTLRRLGLRTAPAHDFPDAAVAATWLRANPGRTVLKHFNNARATFVGTHAAGLDVLYQLGRAPPGPVLLMPVLEGIEVGVGAYFDGTRFLDPACIDFEHKRFFPGEIGEMTGEMGTVVSYRGAAPIMDATLRKLEPMLAAAGHVGYLNLNMIANEDGLWPLEFTCRFGNPGYAILSPLQTAGWGDLFGRMLRGDATGFPTAPDWCVGVVLTVPPFPEERPNSDPALDPPVFFHVPPDDPGHFHFSDMRLADGQLHAGRGTGYAMVVTGTGDSIARAGQAALSRARTVCIPDLRFRNDIGDRVQDGGLDRLRALGWFDA